VDMQENMNLSIIAQRLGVKGADFQYILKNIDTLVVVTPDSEEKRMDHYYRIMNMMKMDLHADEKEIELCKELGKEYGFADEKVEKLIVYLLANMKRFVKYEEVKAILT
jgi:uncharacterized tellurite resistance protein B-like protein